MKKFLAVIMVMAIALTSMAMMACSPDDAEHTEHTWESAWSYDGDSHFKKCTFEDCSEISEEAAHSMVNGKCSVCGLEFNLTVTPNTLTKLTTVKDGYVVKMEVGTYNSFNAPNKKNVVLVGGDDVICKGKITIGPNCENITIKGIEFNSTTEAGILFPSGSVKGATIKDCSFTGNSQIFGRSSGDIEDLIIDNCQFTDIRKNDKLTAILIYNIKNYTVKNCTFRGIEYNAMQLGSNGGSINGTFTVTGNVFDGVGDRVFRITGQSDGITCDISNNEFYDDSDIVSDNSDGYYIKNDNVQKIVFGVNKWERIPEFTDDFFIGQDTIEYDPEVQLEIS